MDCKTKHRLTVLLLLLIVFTLAFIWGNSLLDRSQSQDLSTGLLDLLRPVLALFGIAPEDDHILRKLAHFAEFALLGMELAALVLLEKGQSLKYLSLAVFAGLFVAVSDETIQFFTGRACQFSDMMLDFSGSLCGMLFVCSVSHVWRKKKSKEKIGIS